SREGGIRFAKSNKYPTPHPSPSRGEGGECSWHTPPREEGLARLTRSVASRLSHRLTIRWRETLFHTIELHHPGSERAAAIAGEADAKPRRPGTGRHRGCAERAGQRRADHEPRRRRGRLVRRRAAQQERQ